MKPAHYLLATGGAFLGMTFARLLPPSLSIESPWPSLVVAVLFVGAGVFFGFPDLGVDKASALPYIETGN